MRHPPAAAARRCRRGWRRARRALGIAGLALCGVAVPPAAGQEAAPSAPSIVDVRVEGNRRLSDAAFFRLTTLRSGQPYDAAVVRRQFRALWDAGLFDDLWVETLDAAGGKVVVFHVKERPVVLQVTYPRSPVVSQTAIDDRLRERNLTISLNTPIDRDRIRAVEEELKRMHEEKGHLGTEAVGEVRPLSESTQAIVFTLRIGGKTLIEDIDFTGNESVSDSELKRLLKNSMETGFRGLFSSRDLYHPLRFAQDLEAIRTAYQARGRLDVQIKPPLVRFLEEEGEAPPAAPPPEPPPPPPPDETDKQRAKRLEKEAKAKAKAEAKAAKELPPKRRAVLVVAITEGPEYRVGELRLTGNSVLPEAALRPLIPLRPGDRFNSDLLKTGLDAIEGLYGQRGYFYATTNRDIRRREGYVADVDIAINEGQQYTLRRVEFAGNTSTRDRVLRRELPIHEGEIFDATRWKVGLTRVNQLGFWALAREPQITPAEGEAQLDARLEGAEQGRNEIQVGGGFSGVEGAFFQGSYSTRNFLGRGEVLAASVQVGGRTELVNISFTEPYFLGTNNTLGGSIFRRQLEYTDFSRNSRGFSVLFGQRLGNFGSWSTTYRNEKFDEFGGNIFFVSPDGLPEGFEDLDLEALFAGEIGTPVPQGVETINSSLVPVLLYNTINNPFRPTRGFRLRGSVELTGGFLGGDNDFVKTILAATWFRPALRRSFFAMHFEVGMVNGVGSSLIPRSERFFLGGDTRGPRVFQTRSLAPLGPVAGVPPLSDSEGNVIGVPFATVGGDRFVLAQAELVIPITQPFDLALFFDAGNAFDEQTGLDFGGLRYSAGLEARFYLPVFQAPIRLIFGRVLDGEPADQINSFQFAIGFPF